jgi:hypothetical protein
MLAPAILAWLEKDKQATDADFIAAETPVDDLSIPHGTTPSPWDKLRDAVIHAIEVDRDHTLEPWIKTGDAILNPSQVRQAYNSLAPREM